ncbi:hypothetical protein C8R44DRAFT_661105 [Mycena epipterygia]|nr:hypothetical protein C8R44DRAFT_661105 [Mycena epipterygia]
MTTVKTVVATGASSGLGFGVVKQLLAEAQPCKIILGARDAEGTKNAFHELQFDRGKHSLTVLPLELSDLKSVKSFAQQALEALGQDKLDYLMLNAAVAKGADSEAPVPNPESKLWCEAYVVNHLSQHYLTHLFRAKLVASKSRIVVVSSGGIRMVSDPSVLDNSLKANAGTDHFNVYCQTKFIQLLGAHWWRRQLDGACHVVAVSPGYIPGTGLGRHSDVQPTKEQQARAKTIAEGAQTILLAFMRDDFPVDPEQIFFTTSGEWWGRDVLEKTLDETLQDRWCLSREEIEREAGISA